MLTGNAERKILCQAVTNIGENMRELKYKNYFADREGNIYSLLKVGGQGSFLETPRKLSPKTDKDGYQEVCITHEGKHKYRRVHRLVYEAFKGDIPKGLTIDHIDNDPANNHIDNLQVLTREDNARKATSQPVTIWLDGEKLEFKSNRQAYEYLGVSESSYFKYKKGKTPYIRKYKERKLVIEG